MPAILIIGGLIALFLVIRPKGVDSGVGSVSGPGSNTGLPDPGTTNAYMCGSAAMSVPASGFIPATAGTALVSPGTSYALLSGPNRIASRGIGTPGLSRRVPYAPTVKTTNPAVVPFSAEGTRSFSGTVATTTTGGRGIKL
jgi:hypothetical protein